MELYIGNNKLSYQREIQNLRVHQKLIILDISGNPMSRQPGIREFTIFQLKKLKVLDGIGIEPNETKSAKAMFAGRLTEEILEARLRGLTTDNVKTLDLSNTKLRDFEDVFTFKTYPKLTELNVS
jgi:Leucine-rich repeat (LRR) protein